RVGRIKRSTISSISSSSWYPDTMALLSEADRQAVRTQLAGITHPVTLLFFTQAIAAPETALVAREVLDEIVSLSDRVTLEEVNFVLDKARAAAYGIEGIPAVALLKD